MEEDERSPVFAMIVLGFGVIVSIGLLLFFGSIALGVIFILLSAVTGLNTN